jgi:hypothetical protein
LEEVTREDLVSVSRQHKAYNQEQREKDRVAARHKKLKRRN